MPSPEPIIEPSSSETINSAPSPDQIIEPSSSEIVKEKINISLVNENITPSLSKKEYNDEKSTVLKDDNVGVSVTIIVFTIITFAVIGALIYNKYKLNMKTNRILPIDSKDVKIKILDFKRPKDLLLEKIVLDTNIKLKKNPKIMKKK